MKRTSVRLLSAASPATAILLLVAAVAFAQALVGRVVGITDGHTVTVLAGANTRCRIRLAGIDAPEHNQALGTRSKQNLSRLVFGKTVTLECGKEESYGRWVCEITLPNGEDVCLDQVKAGRRGTTSSSRTSKPQQTARHTQR